MPPLYRGGWHGRQSAGLLPWQWNGSGSASGKQGESSRVEDTLDKMGVAAGLQLDHEEDEVPPETGQREHLDHEQISAR